MVAWQCTFKKARIVSKGFQVLRGSSSDRRLVWISETILVQKAPEFTFSVKWSEFKFLRNTIQPCSSQLADIFSSGFWFSGLCVDCVVESLCSQQTLCFKTRSSCLQQKTTKKIKLQACTLVSRSKWQRADVNSYWWRKIQHLQMKTKIFVDKNKSLMWLNTHLRCIRFINKTSSWMLLGGSLIWTVTRQFAFLLC